MLRYCEELKPKLCITGFNMPMCFIFANSVREGLLERQGGFVVEKYFGGRERRKLGCIATGKR